MPSSPSSTLREFVATGDPSKVRAALRSELNDNQASRESLLDALSYAQSHISGLCEPYEVSAWSGPMNPVPDHWTEDYYDAQVVYIKSNFAVERFRHLVEVRLHLRKCGVLGFVDEEGGTAATPSDAPGRHEAEPTNAPRPANSRSSRLSLTLGICGAIVVLLLLLLRRQSS